MQAKNADGGSGSRRRVKKMLYFQQDTFESKPVLPTRRDPKDSVGPFGKRQSHWLLAADNDRTAVPLVLRFRCTQRPFRLDRRSTHLQAHRQHAKERKSGCESRISERFCK